VTRNSSLFFLFALALFLSIRLIYIYLDNVHEFPITRVKVSADYENVSRTQIQALISSFTKNSFFTFKSGLLTEKLKKIPWVKEVSVSRYWPDTVKVVITEQLPIARVQGNGLITKSGLVFFPPVDTISLDLPLLRGPKGRQKDLLKMYREAAKVFTKLDLTITTLTMTKSLSWSLCINNGVKIYLGKVDPLMRLRRFAKTYPDEFSDKLSNLESVDLRYPQGIAIRWK
jgi:cell division protein FtsQ